jgi:rhodanese-related sulfurtransferase
MIDSRKAESHAAGTIPGARNIPFRQAAERLDELDPEEPTVIFCNGPQCGATPSAIDAMLEAGYPPGAILYYRGGLHDWVSLGLPLEPPG